MHVNKRIFIYLIFLEQFEVSCMYSVGIAKTAVRDWANRDHKIYWESLAGLKHAKGFLQGPSARRTRELLALNRNQLQWVTGLLTGHIVELGLNNNLTCERCLEKGESATHVW
jgi:hypothetical protein